MTENRPVVSRYGVYYDLTKSPYGYETPYGDCFKFSSRKKLDIYTREIDKELERLDKLVDRHGLRQFLPDAVHHTLCKAVYQALYRKVEG